jgi:hypothetical protein
LQLYVYDIISDSIKDITYRHPWFKDCVGAVLDGTLRIYIVHTSLELTDIDNERAAFTDRNGNVLQNVLAIFDFDMRFTDLLSGWEGSSRRLRATGKGCFYSSWEVCTYEEMLDFLNCDYGVYGSHKRINGMYNIIEMAFYGAKNFCKNA